MLLLSIFVEDFGDGLFSQNEITKTMVEKALTEMVLKNPRGVRRGYISYGSINCTFFF